MTARQDDRGLAPWVPAYQNGIPKGKVAGSSLGLVRIGIKNGLKRLVIVAIATHELASELRSILVINVLHLTSETNRVFLVGNSENYLHLAAHLHNFFNVVEFTLTLKLESAFGKVKYSTGQDGRAHLAIDRPGHSRHVNADTPMGPSINKLLPTQELLYGAIDNHTDLDIAYFSLVFKGFLNRCRRVETNSYHFRQNVILTF